MATLNKCMFIGNLGSAPELKTTSSGKQVCNFQIACNKKYKNAAGEVIEKVQWVRIVVWGSAGEACARYLAKGRTVFVEGEMETRSYEDKDGAARYVTEVIARNVQFLGGAKPAQEATTPAAQVPAVPAKTTTPTPRRAPAKKK